MGESMCTIGIVVHRGVRGRQTDRQAGRERGARERERDTDRQTGRERARERDTDRQIGRDRDRQMEEALSLGDRCVVV